MVLTESRFEISDRNTTLCLLEKDPAPDSPLGLATQEGYEAIYRTIDVNPGTSYRELTNNNVGIILKMLSPCYGSEKYWRRYLRSEPRHWLAWSDILPISATLSQRIELIPPVGFKAKASIIPRVFLYPFGWSTWLSFRVTGEHTLEELAALVKHVFSAAAFKVETKKQPVQLQHLFDVISKGVQHDVFLGDDTHPRNASQVARVVTVLAKHGVSPSLRALSQTDDASIRTLLRPDSPNAQGSLKAMSQKLRAPEELNYILFNGLGRFIWMEGLLKPEKRNRQHLICYHQNSFRTLLQSWHLDGLLESYMRLAKKPTRLTELAQFAMEILDDSERFKNASLTALLESRSTQLDKYRNALSAHPD